MICKLCKKQEAIPGKDICDTCLLEIELAFSYHIDGFEVTKEEYDRRIKEAFKHE